MKNNDKVKNILIVFLLLLVVGLTGYIAYDKFYIESDEVVVEEKKDKIVDVTDEMRSKFTKAVELLEKAGNDEQYGSSNLGSITYVYSKDVVTNDEISITNAYHNLFWKNLDSKDFVLGDMASNETVYTGSNDKIDEIVLFVDNLFGKKTSIPTDMKGCPRFHYSDGKLSRYSACGYAAQKYNFSYIYKIESEKDAVRVHVAVGGFLPFDDEGKYEEHVYYDSKFSKFGFKFTGETINEENYNLFEKFTYEFTKNDNGSYRFVKVSKD